MSVIYIAGPMTGKPNFNRKKFIETATHLWAEGHTVLNPAMLPDGLAYEHYWISASPCCAVLTKFTCLMAGRIQTAQKESSTWQDGYAWKSPPRKAVKGVHHAERLPLPYR